MPAATMRSATDWAATAGVAITPIDTASSATMDSRSSKDRRVTPSGAFSSA